LWKKYFTECADVADPTGHNPLQQHMASLPGCPMRLSSPLRASSKASLTLLPPRAIAHGFIRRLEPHRSGACASYASHCAQRVNTQKRPPDQTTKITRNLLNLCSIR
jgi:hypothetical protein